MTRPTGAEPAAEHHEVVAALLVDSDRVLLCHRHPQRRWHPDVWDLPGGHVEDEETLDQALCRELGEELGIRARPDSDQPIRTYRPNDDLTLHVWIVTRWDGQVVNQAPEEHDAIGWFALDEVGDLDLAFPEITELAALALGGGA